MLRRYLILVLAALATSGHAQLSPGDLTEAHAKLEGMSNCTQCHDLGNKVTNAKCLDCHKEMKALITAKRGFHASKAVKGQDCFKCHSEHHGRKFEMVRFDEKTFDHGLTGYSLQGAHKPIDCRDCHKPDNIKDREIKARKGTFLGMDEACLSCHKDFHQGTMSGECLKCHDMQVFRPASKFDHNATDFKLKGKHVPVDCRECHEMIIRNGVDFQVFNDVPHTDCKACHDDPHNSRIGGACAQCHSEDGFSIFQGKGRFDHNSTSFELIGQHRTTDCYACHAKSSDPLRVFADRKGVGMNQCATCHEDAHDGKFGTDCAQCHQETGFKKLQNMDSFDHALTDFPLQGKHVQVDCKKCHPKSLTEAIIFDACNRCHADFHEGEFAKNGVSPDCVECHFLTDGFETSSFTFEQHGSTKFPLEGAHMATPCNSCHMKEDKWRFREIGSACIDCHDNVHGEDFAVNGITDCTRCHVPETWFPSKFDHDLTDFPLVGEHVNVECKQCHTVASDGKVPSFKIQKYECADCHK